mgnify:CR=1 FL=1
MFGVIHNGTDSQERRKLCTWQEYELGVLRTTPEDTDFSPGVVGETGELIDLWKKQHNQRQDIPRQKIIEEAGDALWYVAARSPLGGPIEYADCDHAPWWELYVKTFAFMTGDDDPTPVVSAILSLVKEMTGDTLTAEELFSEIALYNLMKLAKRYPEGFAPGGGIR